MIATAGEGKTGGDNRISARAETTSTGLFRRPVVLREHIRYVPFSIDVWCPVARVDALPHGGLMRTELLGNPIVLFRGEDGGVNALEDRCPHRGVALSMGRVCGNLVQCAYHGWKIDGSGRARLAEEFDLTEDPPETPAYAVREGYGLIWIFLGDTVAARRIPMPRLDAGGARNPIDLLIDLEIDAHWSFVLDNGLDLFHQHLHREVPFFFRIDGLEHYGSDGEAFTARYKARFRGGLGRCRPGAIDIRVDGNIATLKFDNEVFIYGIPTPRSANGRKLTMWWLIRMTPRLEHRLIFRMLMPFVRAQIIRGFRQDCDVLASEQRAFDRGFRKQREINPVIVALHDHLEGCITRQTALLGSQALTEGNSELEPVLVERGRLIQHIRCGEAVAVKWHADHPRLLAPGNLSSLLPGDAMLRTYRCRHVYVVL